jgi:hypothetical protein
MTERYTEGTEVRRNTEINGDSCMQSWKVETNYLSGLRISVFSVYLFFRNVTTSNLTERYMEGTEVRRNTEIDRSQRPNNFEP